MLFSYDVSDVEFTTIEATKEFYEKREISHLDIACSHVDWPLCACFEVVY